MQNKRFLLGVCTFGCLGVAAWMALPTQVHAQTLYVPNSNASSSEQSAEPKLYVTPGNGDYSATLPSSYGSSSNAAPSNQKFYNAPDEPRSRRNPVDTNARSTQLKEIQDINIQTAHNESVENSKRVQAAQLQWKAKRDADNKKYYEDEAAQMAKDGIALQNGAQIGGEGTEAGVEGQQQGGEGQTTLYVKRDPVKDLNKPARVFNIFE